MFPHRLFQDCLKGEGLKLGKVIGTVVCSRKIDSLEGVKLLLLQPMDESWKPAGGPVVACDTVQAGEGDYVLWEAGREAALALENWFNPSDATIMGIVDRESGSLEI